jgi:hypothetical protein
MQIAWISLIPCGETGVACVDVEFSVSKCHAKRAPARFRSVHALGGALLLVALGHLPARHELFI